MSAFVFNVTFDCRDPERLSDFWAAVTGYQRTELRADFARLRAPDGRGVRHLLFYKVPEAKSAKSRVHVDLASRSPAEEVQRLQELGARELYRVGELGGGGWVTMADPEGNEFCIG
jgi:predicted enzyme related to lactoylglutathione lyase